MTGRVNGPGSDEIKEAVKSVRRGDRWHDARAVLRPRRVFGFVRSGLPLGKRLVLAAAQGRLVWDGPDAFVVLEPPMSPSARSSEAAEPVVASEGPFLLRTAHSHWELVVGLGPAIALLVLGALGAGLVTAVPSTLETVRPVVLVMMVAAVAYVGVAITGAVVHLLVQLVRTGSRRSEVALGQVQSMQWSAALVHAVDADALPALVRRALQIAAADVLVVPAAALTTSAARTALREMPEVHALTLNPEVFVAAARDEPLPTPNGGGHWWRDLGFFLGTTSAFLLVMAYLVPIWEDKGEPLDSYGQSLYWAVTRVISGGDPNGVGPSSWQNQVLASLLSFYGVFVLAYIVTTILDRQANENRASGLELVERYNKAQQERTAAAANSQPAPPTAVPECGLAGVLWRLGRQLQYAARHLDRNGSSPKRPPS